MMKLLKPEIMALIEEKGVDGQIKLNFDQFKFLGSKQSTNIIFMKFDNTGSQFQLLEEIVNLILASSLEHKLLTKDELFNFLKFNKGFYKQPKNKDIDVWQLNNL